MVLPRANQCFLQLHIPNWIAVRTPAVAAELLPLAKRVFLLYHSEFCHEYNSCNFRGESQLAINLLHVQTSGYDQAG